MSRFLLVVLIGGIIGVTMTPITSAQDQEATLHLDISVEMIKNINLAAEYCRGSCTVQDFIPIVHGDGSIDDHVFIYWPRTTVGTFTVPEHAMLGYDPALNGLFPLEAGMHPDIKWGLVSTGGNFYELLSYLASPDQLGPNGMGEFFPYLPDCSTSTCQSVDIFAWVFPVGLRISEMDPQQLNPLYIPSCVEVVGWNGMEFMAIKGPGTLANMPYNAAWFQYTPNCLYT